MVWTRVFGRLGWVGTGIGLMLAAGVARAQGGCTFTDESGKTVFWPNCQDPADKTSPDGKAMPPANGQTQTPGQTPGQPPAAGSANPAKSFPFPVDSPAAPANGQTAPAGQPGGAAGSAAGTPASPAASKFPFPEQDSAGAPGSGPLKDSGSSGNSSSSSGSSSSGPPERDPTAGPLGDDADTDPAAKAAEARRAARAKRGIDFHQTTDQREAEDLRVAAFYRDDGNFRGMYERATDAVALADDDADAHLALAEAARRLGKLDEALAHYRKCLTLDPVPKTKKAAEKALKEMTAGG
ncbi:MAG: tetratricopeptide repeat protein [Acidobacteriaceae bacterium]